jgi:hypothetical protein
MGKNSNSSGYLGIHNSSKFLLTNFFISKLSFISELLQKLEIYLHARTLSLPAGKLNYTVVILNYSFDD